jgi:hypothetical protein
MGIAANKRSINHLHATPAALHEKKASFSA